MWHDTFIQWYILAPLKSDIKNFELHKIVAKFSLYEYKGTPIFLLMELHMTTLIMESLFNSDKM